MKRRVLVCGGRDYNDSDRVWEVLDGIDIAEVCHGAATGADSLADYWVSQREGVKVHAYPADWRKHGRAAGPIRNQQMLDEFKPDLVVAFPGGRGTEHMVRIAKAAGVEVIEVRECGCGVCIEQRRKALLDAGGSFADYISRFMILRPDCGNKRCPKATHHIYPCSGSNEPNQPGSSYQYADCAVPRPKDAT